MNTQIYDLVVLGSGPAGLTAGLYGHRSGLKVCIAGGEMPGGQVMRHYRIENYPGFPGGVTGAELMARWLRQVIDETGAAPQSEIVTNIDFSSPIKRVLVGSQLVGARSLVIATGAAPRRLLVPGESEFEGKGVFYCATCDGPMLRTMTSRHAAVIGGGDTAFHTAVSLLPHADSITIITRGISPKAKLALTRQLEKDQKIRVLTHRSVTAVKGTKAVTELVLQNTRTQETETFPVNAVFVGIGQSPVTEFLEGKLELNEKGFIVTDGMLRTSVPGVFAAGDVRDTPLRQIITAAADGALAAESAGQYVRMNLTT